MRPGQPVWKQSLFTMQSSQRHCLDMHRLSPIEHGWIRSGMPLRDTCAALGLYMRSQGIREPNISFVIAKWEWVIESDWWDVLTCITTRVCKIGWTKKFRLPYLQRSGPRETSWNCRPCSRRRSMKNNGFPYLQSRRVPVRRVDVFLPVLEEDL